MSGLRSGPAKPALMAFAAALPCHLQAASDGMPPPAKGRLANSTSTTGRTISARTRSPISRKSTTSRSATTPTTATRPSKPSWSSATPDTTSSSPPRPSSPARSRAASIMKLDRSKLTNWSNLDQWVLHAIRRPTTPATTMPCPYMWGTNGFTYNVDMIKERMPDAPVDSLRMLFDPEVVSKFQDCGVSFLDSPEDVLPARPGLHGQGSRRRRTPTTSSRRPTC